MAIAKIKTFLDNGLKSVRTPLDRTANLEPEVGIRVVHSSNNRTLRVTVLGARHLPQNFGFTRVNSYVVKVKLFPGKEKFETTSKNESWPQWNEEFTFRLRKESKVRFGKSQVVEEDISASKMLITTLYAILEDKPLIASEKKEAQKENTSSQTKKKDEKHKEATGGGGAGASGSNDQKGKKIFNNFFKKDKTSEPTAAERKNIDKRRVVGATTISLEPKIFSKPLRSNCSGDVSTEDLWKPLRAIASGISGAEDRRENKKGQVEMILTQEKSDKKDVSEGKLVLSLSRLRCSLDTMREHELLKGQLYIKLAVHEAGKVTQFWKSNPFPPSVSLKFSPDEAKVIADNPYEGALKDVTFVVKFVSKNKMGKKTTIGHLVLGPEAGGTSADQWKQALAKPGQSITMWQKFE